MPDSRDLLFDMAGERDKLEFALWDTADVKASIILLVITFLATLAGSILADKDFSLVPKLAQMVIVGFLAVSGVYAVLCLKPRDYSMEKLPDEYEEWLSKLKSYYETHYADQSDRESKVCAEFRGGVLAKTMERIKSNRNITRKKFEYLYASFWLVVIALGLELVTLFVAAMPLFSAAHYQAAAVGVVAAAVVGRAVA